MTTGVQVLTIIAAVFVCLMTLAVWYSVSKDKE